MRGGELDEALLVMRRLIVEDEENLAQPRLDAAHLIRLWFMRAGEGERNGEAQRDQEAAHAPGVVRELCEGVSRAEVFAVVHQLSRTRANIASQ